MKVPYVYYDLVSFVNGLCGAIVMFVTCVIYWNVTSTGVNMFASEDQTVELLWTFIPSFFVSMLCWFNMGYIVYFFQGGTAWKKKVLGFQWYWQYSCLAGEYNSYPLSDYFQVDKPLVLEYKRPVRLLMSSNDVIHSFAVPSLGLKADAMPGRVNQLLFVPDCFGVFIGYCSELCGAGHSYMPIVVEVIK